VTAAEKWRTLGRTLVLTIPPGALIGLGLGLVIAGAGVAALAGAAIGLLITAGMVGFNVSWAVRLIPRGWREAPFLVVVLTRSLVWLLVIVLGVSLPLLTIAGLSTAELVDQQFVAAVGVSFVGALVANFVGQVNGLLGRGVLVGLILGRYHRPREEVRIFLFVDVRESTQIAERLGNLRYHAFLNRFIDDVTASVGRYRGDVHRYVGDEVILTWTAEEGLRDAACVRAVFAISDTLDAARMAYEADFGVVPSFWAGLHMGQVVTAEIGTVKHEIAFLGDTLNTASRIEQASKDRQRQVLASAALVAALDLPNDITSESLGPTELRGMNEPVELVALTRVAAAPRTA
jgi:adenylate cyclase